MKRKTLAVLMLACVPAIASAVDRDDFILRSGQDLVDVCSVRSDDPLYTAAIHFCHGYVTGLRHYDQVVRADPSMQPIVCTAEPRPTRNEAIAGFLAWAKTNSGHLSESTVDVVFRYATERWPCPSDR